MLNVKRAPLALSQEHPKCFQSSPEVDPARLPAQDAEILLFPPPYKLVYPDAMGKNRKRGSCHHFVCCTK